MPMICLTGGFSRKFIVDEPQFQIDLIDELLFLYLGLLFVYNYYMTSNRKSIDIFRASFYHGIV